MSKAWQIGIALVVLALGAAYAIGAQEFPGETGYAGISARFFPGLVATFLLIVGALLLWQSLTGGLRNFTDDLAEVVADYRGGLWVSAGILLHAVLINHIGFVLAATVLFTCAARGFGSTKWWRDILIGVALVLPVFWLFTQLLDVSLPQLLNGWI